MLTMKLSIEKFFDHNEFSRLKNKCKKYINKFAVFLTFDFCFINFGDLYYTKPK